MTHHDAQREMSVERYLLGELEGDARDEFENHLFDCALCGADVQTGADFTEGVRSSGPQLVPQPARTTLPAQTLKSRASTWAASLLQPWIAVPALAACLGVIGVQSFVIQPRLHREIAEAQVPGLVSGLTIMGPTRGLETGPVSEVKAQPGGGFLVSLNIPTQPQFQAYRCILVSSTGKSVRLTELSPEQVKNPVDIYVPVASTAAGLNVLKVEGIAQAKGGQVALLLQRNFNLRISR